MGAAAPSSAQAQWLRTEGIYQCGGYAECFAWYGNDGLEDYSVGPVTTVQFETFVEEGVAVIDEIGNRPVTGLGSAEVEAGKTAAGALEGEGDTAVLAGAEDAVEAVTPVASFSSLGTFALAAGAVSIGWEIGNALDGLLGIEGFGSIFGGSSGGTQHWQAKQVKAVSRGDKLTSTSHSPLAPADGFVAVFCKYESSCSGKTQVVSGESGVEFEGVPPGFEFVLEEVVKNGSETWTLGAYFEKAPLQALEPHTGPVGSVFPGTTYSGASALRSPAPTLAEQKASMASRVLENPEDDAFSEWLLDHDGVAGHSEVFARSVAVPSVCRLGAKAGPCITALQELDVVPKVKELDWEEAVVEELEELDPEKTREEESERIIELPNPLPAEVTKGAEFDITVNPDKEHMPEFIPEPGEGETEEEYKERKVPWIPLPFWHAEELDDATLDPSKGPEEITHMSPAPGTRVNPDGETDEHVRFNPKTAPSPGEAGSTSGGFTPPTVPAISAPGLAVHPCGVFPFGLFCWVKEAIQEINVAPKCPSAQVPLGVGQDKMELGICKLPEVEHWIGLWRTLVVFFFSIGCAWTFAKATGALGGGGDED